MRSIYVAIFQALRHMGNETCMRHSLFGEFYKYRYLLLVNDYQQIGHDIVYGIVPCGIQYPEENISHDSPATIRVGNAEIQFFELMYKVQSNAILYNSATFEQKCSWKGPRHGSFLYRLLSLASPTKEKQSDACATVPKFLQYSEIYYKFWLRVINSNCEVAKQQCMRFLILKMWENKLL